MKLPFQPWRSDDPSWLARIGHECRVIKKPCRPQLGNLPVKRQLLLSPSGGGHLPWRDFFKGEWVAKGVRLKMPLQRVDASRRG